MWKILILVNRLVFSPSYFAIVLRGLTDTGDMFSLTVDVAIKLSRQGNENMQQDSMTKQTIRTEIVNLACIFKKRVCA